MPHRSSASTAAARTALLASLLVCASASAQPFPSKPIRYVVPFPAGSATDTLFRPVVEHMSRTLGQNVLMDFRPGGGGVVASNYVKSQPADGYTFYLASNALLSQTFRAGTGIDIRRDFTPIAPTAYAPIVLAVNSDLGLKTLKDVIAHARANPGKLNYASYGIGSGAHVFMELIKQETKTFVLHIPYQGTAQATADAAAGRVELTATILQTVRPFVGSLGGSGRLLLLAVGSVERTPLLPDVPGMREAGLPQIDFTLWGGFVGPTGLPPGVIEPLARATNAAYKDPAIADLARKFGQVPVIGGPGDLARMIEQEYVATARLVKEAGLKFE
jgi:tripartite-type tricarboxylate transporter receptor subunit TctC